MTPERIAEIEAAFGEETLMAIIDFADVAELCRLARLGLRVEEAEVARLTAANGWRPIESAPNTSDVVLFFCRESRTRQSVHITRADDYYNGAYWRKEATHWMPLPEPPKENSNG